MADLEVEISYEEYQRLKAKEKARDAAIWRSKGMDGDSYLGEDAGFVAYLWREAGAVALHTIGVISIQLLIYPLKQQQKSQGFTMASLMTEPLRGICELFLGPISNLRYPGFFVTCVGLILYVRERRQVLPNLPCRICQQRMDHMSPADLVAVAAVHLVAVTSILLLTKSMFSQPIFELVVPVVRYSTSNDAGISFLIKEVLLTAVYVVGVQVLPVLLKLNRASKWWCDVLLYPIFCASVDESGIGSTFNPIYLFAQTLVRGENLAMGRILAQVLGAILAGRTMNVFFPDDSL